MSSDLKTARRRRVGRGPVAVPVSSLVVPVTAAVAAAAFFAWKPGVARSMLASPRALGFTVLVGVLVFGLGWLVAPPGPRHPRDDRGAGGSGPDRLRRDRVAGIPQRGRERSLPGCVGPPPTARPAAPPVEQAAVVGRGGLQGIDHRASGDVLLVRSTEGYIVRLQSLDVEPGPDYHVHVVPGAERKSPDGGVHLDRLRGNKGNQNYPVPTTVGLQRPFTVLIWCRAFAVPIAAATIR